MIIKHYSDENNVLKNNYLYIGDKMTWYNRKRIEEKYDVSSRGLMTASEIKDEFGIPTEVTTSLFRPVEWHHTNVEGRYGGNPTDFYDLEEIEDALNNPENEKHEALLKALAEYKDKKKFKVIKKVSGYFGFRDYDGSNAVWYHGTTTLIENGYGSRWWILPDGRKKRELKFISEEEFKRKRISMSIRTKFEVRFKYFYTKYI